MIANYFLVLYRSLGRQPLYAALNVFGLAAGIAVFLVLTLVVRYEASYDRWLPHASETYLIDSTFFNPGQAPAEYAEASFVMLPWLRQDFPQITGAARTMDRDDTVSVGPVIDSEQVTYVDPSFLQIVELPLITGDRAAALANPASVVLDESIARKYFGTTQVVGRMLDIAHNGIKRAYTVSAVMQDLPGNTSLKLSLLAPMIPAAEQGVQSFQSWQSLSGKIFVRLRSPADAATLDAAFPDFLRRHATGNSANQLGLNPTVNCQLLLVALPDAHFHDVYVQADVPGVDRRVVLSLGAVGLMALLTAAINYVNLATARAGLRAREVALRKVVGATRAMLMAQFLAEAVVVVALAALIGLAATEVALPLVNEVGGWEVRIDYGTVVPGLLLLTLVVGLGAGCYPALLLASYRPSVVLASARTPAGGRMGTNLRNLLVLLQFISAIAFAICTLVIDAQAELLRSADRGFERPGLIIVRSLSAHELQPRQIALLSALRGVTGVTAATISDRQPDSDDTNNTSNVHRVGLVSPAPTLALEDVGDDYLEAYGVHLIVGRWFDDAHRLDDMAGSNGAGRTFNGVINRTAARALGFVDPNAALGQSITTKFSGGILTLNIIGVVQDVRFMSPRNPVAPQLYVHDSHAIQDGEGAIRFSGVPEADLMQRLQQVWHNAAPDEAFSAESAEGRLADYYEPDQQRAQLFSAGAVLAVMIACVGLYGLASFSTARRVKEIGIRKVLGASSRDVLLLLVGQFVRPVLLANLIAWPLAWAAMRFWLAGFDQRVELSPLYFLAAGGGALAIAILTVVGQAVRVAGAEPAKALRYE